MWTKGTLVGAAVGLLLAASGCASRLTRDNYDRIRTGMNRGQVESILGKGEREGDWGGDISVGDFSASANVMVWGDEDRFIQITFINGEVKSKVARGLE